MLFKEGQVFFGSAQSLALAYLVFFLGATIASVGQKASQRIEESHEAISLKPYPYGLDKAWSNSISVTTMSPNGNWIAFTEYFSVGENILRLQQVDKQSNFNLPQGLKNKFSRDNKWFGTLSLDNQFVLINLETGHKNNFALVHDFDFSFDGKYLSIHQKEPNETYNLKILDLENNTVSNFNQVNNLSWNPKNNFILIVKGGEQKKVIGYNAASADQTVIARELLGTINYLKWNDTGTAAVIMEEIKENRRLSRYHLEKDLINLKETLFEKQLPQYEISDKEPFISNDGNTILFYRKLKGREDSKKDKLLEVWNTSDPLLFPNLKMRQDFIYSHLLTAWYPKNNALKEIATLQYPSAEMDIEHDFAIVYNELQYGDQNTEFLKADIYCKNVKTQEMHLVVTEQQLTDLVTISPSGKYIAYFYKGDWWTYEIAKNKKRNITGLLEANFQNKEEELPIDRIEIYDRPAWLQNDSIMIISDGYDLWIVDPTGKHARRVTKGREKKYRYRLKKANDVEESYALTVGTFSGKKLNLDKNPILQLINYNTHSTGFSLLDKNFEVIDLLFTDKSIFQIYQSSDGEDLIYSTESTTSPKALNHYNINSKENKLLYQSNEELLNYDLGQKTFINYKVGNKNLMGVLMLPANFNPSKKYPMIVNIYEKISRNVMEFYPPTGYNYQGFSLLNYTTSGYFVLLPDISYEIGKPALSALECVNQATDKATENENIDKKRIGLIGHSFGGYETVFIATHTNRFATFVAGAAATNVISHYHGVNWDNSETDLWRYEDQQWRMGTSYYENKQAYLENSPLEFVENINSPILLWTGDKDYQVAWTQSIEMFIALRRLKKDASLIIVKDEGHSPWNTQKQLLLSKEIKRWLDQYLKKENGES